MLTAEQLLAKAAQPAAEAIRLHPRYKGKVQIMPKCPIRGLEDFAVWYTPGVGALIAAVLFWPERSTQGTAGASGPAPCTRKPGRTSPAHAHLW